MPIPTPDRRDDPRPRTGGPKNTAALLILLGGHPLALTTYFWLHTTLKATRRWPTFRLLTSPPALAATATTTPATAEVLIQHLTGELSD